MAVQNVLFSASIKTDVRSRYHLTSVLGKGGGGVVHTACDVITGEPTAACKSIPKSRLQVSDGVTVRKENFTSDAQEGYT